MKKRARVWLSIIGAVALIAGAAAAAYQLNDTVKDWVDSEIGKIIPATSGSTDSDAPAETLSSGPLSAKIYGGTVFGAGGKLESLQAGATKTVVFTVAPANASDKYVLVASSDTSKVTVSPAKVLSGSAVTLTLVAGYFSGTVSITAKPEALTTAVLTFPVTAYNAVTGLNLEGVYVLGDPNCTSWDDLDTVKVQEFCPAGASALYYGSPTGHPIFFSWDKDSSSACWFLTASAHAYLAFAFNVVAYDNSANPTASAGPAGTVFDKTGGLPYLFMYVALSTTAAVSSVASSNTVTFEQATFSYSVLDYVAPTGVTADSGSVVFE